MNEALFFLHVGVITLFAYVALAMGQRALAMYGALLSVLANLFVTKQVVLFGLDVTCADAYAVGGFLSLNLFQERFGKSATKKLIWVNFFALGVFAVLSFIHVLYLPSSSDWAHTHFAPLLQHSPRIVGASFITYFVVQRIDVELFGFLRNRIGSFGLTLFCSLMVSQVIDTVLFSFLGLYGILSHLVQIALFSILIKWVIVATMSVLGRFRRAV